MNFDEQLALAYSKNWDAARRLVQELVAPKLTSQGVAIAYQWLARHAELTGNDLSKEGWIINDIAMYRHGEGRDFNMLLRMNKPHYTCEHMGFSHRAPCSECQVSYDFKEVIVPAAFLNEQGVAL